MQARRYIRRKLGMIDCFSYDEIRNIKLLSIELAAIIA